MWQKLGKYYPVALEMLPLILLVMSFYIALSNYSVLPDTVPTHFDIHGVADGWSSRNTVFIFPGINGLVYLLLSFITVHLVTTDDPMRYINVPNKKRKEDLTNAQIEGLRIFLSRSLFILKVLIGGLCIYGVYNTVEIAMGRASTLGAPFSAFIVVIVAVALFMAWKATNISSS